MAQGAAVGGGSLIYANISAVPPPSSFAVGWPPEITYQDLMPGYATVGAVMNVQKVPDDQWTPRMHLMRDAAQAIGAAERFRQLDLAVSFDKGFVSGADPVWHDNAQGVRQGTCVHCGNCDIGCPVDAKNTLDRTYLALAERKGAEIRPLHLVTGIEPNGTGWCVRSTGWTMAAGSRTGPRPGSSWSPPDRSTPPNCCCAAATCCARCRTSANAWAMTGAATATS